MVAAHGRAAGSASDSNPGSRLYPPVPLPGTLTLLPFFSRCRPSRSTPKWLVRRIGGVVGRKAL
jgi:hypothetical protein